MEYKDCNNCETKDCVKCEKKDRFSNQVICGEECILDNLTEEMYMKSDLKLICEVMNKLHNRG